MGTRKEKQMKKIGRGKEQLERKEMMKADSRDRRQSKIQYKSPRTNLNVYHLN